MYVVKRCFSSHHDRKRKKIVSLLKLFASNSLDELLTFPF